jgi:hypothetical protein
LFFEGILRDQGRLASAAVDSTGVNRSTDETVQPEKKPPPLISLNRGDGWKRIAPGRKIISTACAKL